MNVLAEDRPTDAEGTNRFLGTDLNRGVFGDRDSSLGAREHDASTVKKAASHQRPTDQGPGVHPVFSFGHAHDCCVIGGGASLMSCGTQPAKKPGGTAQPRESTSGAHRHDA